MSLYRLKLFTAPCFYTKVRTFIMTFKTLPPWLLPYSLASPLFPPSALCSIHTKLLEVPLMHPVSPLCPSLPPTYPLSSLLASWDLPILPSFSFPTPPPIPPSPLLSPPLPSYFHHLLTPTYPIVFNCDFTSSVKTYLPLCLANLC